MTNNQIKKIRKSRGWTQKELAEYIGVSIRTVQGWEMGKNPSLAVKFILNNLTK